MRDEFFWLGQKNKATVVTNTRLGLLSTDLAKKAAAGIQSVLDSGHDAGWAGDGAVFDARE